MPTRLSSYYNDPNIGRGFDNLASAFAPMEASDVLAGEKAKATRESAGRLAALFEAAKNPGVTREQIDRLGIGSGAFNPNQSYYSVDQGNRTTLSTNAADNARALQQTRLTNETDLAKNANTVRGSTISSLYGPLNPGQVRPDVPVEVASTVGLPALAQTQGLPKPMTEDEVKANILRGLPGNEQRAVTLGNTPVENVVTPAGPRVAFRADAVGQEPAPTPVMPTTAGNYRTQDGREGTAVLRNGTLYDSQTGQAVPPGTVQFSTAVQGKKDDVIGTSTQSGLDQRGIDIATAQTTANSLRKLVTDNPAAQGLVGNIRGTVQDVLATGGEVGRLFNLNVDSLQKDMAAGRIDPEVAARFQNFDKAIPAANLLETMLTAQVAKILDPAGRISNDRYNAVAKSIGAGGLLGNSQRTLATLDQLDRIFEGQRQLLGPQQSRGVTDIQSRAPAGPGASAPLPTANADVPVINTPEEAMRLGPGAKFKTPDGRVKIVPQR